MNIRYSDKISATDKLKITTFIVELNETIKNFVNSRNYELVYINSDGCNIIANGKNYLIQYKLNYELQGFTIIIEERNTKQTMFIDIKLSELDNNNIKNNIVCYIDAEIEK